tara:strand:- start:15 stop:152 length:138 start_codon:yes stop_codon:yes gene_type:complete
MNLNGEYPTLNEILLAIKLINNLNFNLISENEKKYSLNNYDKIEI